MTTPPDLGTFSLGDMSLGERRAFARATGYSIESLADDNIPGPEREEMLCLLYTSPSPRDRQKSRMPSSA